MSNDNSWRDQKIKGTSWSAVTFIVHHCTIFVRTAAMNVCHIQNSRFSLPTPVAIQWRLFSRPPLSYSAQFWSFVFVPRGVQQTMVAVIFYHVVSHMALPGRGRSVCSHGKSSRSDMTPSLTCSALIGQENRHQNCFCRVNDWNEAVRRRVRQDLDIPISSSIQRQRLITESVPAQACPALTNFPQVALLAVEDSTEVNAFSSP